MLLQKLKEYADTRMSLPPSLYDTKPVRYIVELDGTGKLRSPHPIDTADPASKQTRRGTNLPIPQVGRTSGVKPFLLVDHAEYVLGIPREKSTPEKAAAYYAAYCALVERCAAETGEVAVQAVLAFLQSNPTEQLLLPADFDASANMAFRVDGVFPTDLPAVQDFWVAENADAGALVMQCVVCRRERPVLKTMPGNIKRIPGGQMSGNAIISANSKAFESYGLEGSLIAPTCVECAERFTLALNGLLGDERNHVRIAGSAVFVFWTREAVAFDFGMALNQPDAQQVKDLIETVFYKRRVPEVDDVVFYATLLSASGARVMVRDWVDTTVWDVKRSLARWFQWQRVADNPEYDEPRPVGLYGLAASTVRDMKDVPPTTIRALLRGILFDSRVPVWLLFQAVRRSRAEQDVSRQRAALIKLVLIQEGVIEEDCMVELDLSNTDAAYCCGRLLAVLAEVQRNAIGKAAIVDRFYGTASSAPASVFPRLMRGARPHLAKLHRDRSNVAAALEQRLEEITVGIAQFPSTLTLKEQGLFALGFYHQRAYDRAQMKAAGERKRLRDEG